MGYSNRKGFFLSMVMIPGFILSFQPLKIANAQEKGKFYLGPQLIPIEVKKGNTFYDPWPQTLVSNCSNSDFSNGDWTNWQGCYGHFQNSCEFLGFQETGDHPTHKIIPGPGYLDYNTCDSLINVFPGESFVARLGDTSYSGPSFFWFKGAELKYQVTVTSNSYLFIYRYAVVLQTGGHTSNMQPDFMVMITNEAGTVLDSTCGYYYITAQLSGPPVPGWHRCNWAGNGAVYWKDWTTVGMDLTSYLGQTIYIAFKARGCWYDTHFGYAYISSYCNQLQIQTALCEGQDSATLTAPPGFSYYWLAITGDHTVDGDTTASITVPSVQGDIYQCTLTALNGCTVTITNTLHYTQIHTGFTETLNCAQRPSSFQDTTWVSQNDVVAWRWFFGDPDSGVNDSSHLEAPTHSFTTDGNFNVTLISYSTDGCCDTTAKQVSIDSLPDVSNTSHYKLICSHDSTDIILTSNVSGTLFTWTATATSPLITGFSNQTTPVTYLNQHLINNGNEIDSVVYNVIPHKNTCTGDDTNFYVAVYPHPNLTNPILVKSICDSNLTNIKLESNLDSTLFTWICTASSPYVAGYSNNISNPDTIIDQLLWNTGSTIDTVYYYIVPHAFSCLGDTTIYKVAVYPDIDLATSLLFGTCSGADFNIPLTSLPPGASFSWITPVPTCTPNIAFCPPGDSGPAISGNLSVTDFLQGTATYYVTPTLNGCLGITKELVVTVAPLPDVTTIPSSPSSICSGQTTNIALQSTFSTTTFTWTAPTCTNIQFPPGPGSGNLITDILQLASNSIPGSAIYTVTPSNGGCLGNPVQHTVNVKQLPVPAISGSQNFNLCAGASEIYTTETGMTNYAWSISAGGVINSGQGTNVINVTWNMVGSRTVQVTYTNTDNCNPASPTIQVVTVKPIPNVVPAVPSPITICSGTNAQVELSSTVPGTETITTFGWTASGNGATITPVPSTISGSGDILQNLANSGNILEPVVFHIIPTAAGCSPASPTDFTFNVNPVPVIQTSPGIQQEICTATTTQPIVLQTNVTGISPTYSWTSTCDPGIINCPPASGTSNPIASFTPINPTTAQKTITYSIVASLAATSGSCPGPTAGYTILVDPLPVSTFTGSTTVCQLHPDPYLYPANSGPPCSYTWSITPPSYGSIVNPTVSPASITWNLPGQATLRLDAITPFGCTSFSSQIITIDPRPEVSITPCFDLVTSRSAKRFLLKGGRPLLTSTPLQGEYLITPATVALVFDAGNYYFDPTLVAGTQIITFNISYKYTSSQFGCPATSPTSVALTVRGVNPSCGATMTDYRDIPPTTYRTAFTAGRCWIMENMRYGSSLIPTTTYQTDNCVVEKYCLPSDATCTSYGGLYQWDELIQYGVTAGPEYQGVCPPGWHIPSAADYQMLIDANLGNSLAGAVLTDLNLIPRGFEALLGGMYYLNTSWVYLAGSYPHGTMFWTSTPGTGNKIITRGMNFPNYSVSWYETSKANAFPVRCVKD